MEEKFDIGDIVLSKAGRDKGNYFVIMSLEGMFAQICDGDLHKTDGPKKKKLKHLKSMESCSEYIKEKLLQDAKVTNKELRRAVAEFEEGSTSVENI